MKKHQLIKKSSYQSSIKSDKKLYSSTERVMDNVPCPPAHLLTIKEIFGTSG
jgi:hypothetical protein